MDIKTRHQQAIEDWTYVQHLSQCTPLAHRPVIGPIASFLARLPLIGSAIRGLQRVRYLGALSQRQLIVNQVCFQEEQFYGHFVNATNEVLATLQREAAEVMVLQRDVAGLLNHLQDQMGQSGVPSDGVVELQRRMADVLGHGRVLEERIMSLQDQVGQSGVPSDGVVELQRRMADVLGHGQFLEERIMSLLEMFLRIEAGHNTLEAQLSMTSAELDAALHREAGELRSRLDEITAGTEPLQKEVRMLTSHMRLLRYQMEQTIGGDGAGENGRPAPAEAAPAVVALLESQMPELKVGRRVGLSVDGDGAEDAVLALLSYFGPRLATELVDIIICDVHYHIDFSPGWNNPVIFQGAAKKLEPGGHLVIVTGSSDVSCPQPERFCPVADRVLTAGTATARVMVWRSQRADDDTQPERSGALLEGVEHRSM